MINDTFKAFEGIKEKYGLVQCKRTTLFGAKIDTWAFPDALNANGFVIEHIFGLRFADKCFYDADDDCIKFIGMVNVEPSNFDYKIKSLREMFVNAQIKMKQHRMENKIERIKGDFE